MTPLSSQELARINIVCSQAVARMNDLWSDFLLSLAHIDIFFMSLNRYYVQGRDFMITNTIAITLPKSTKKK